MLDDLTMWTKEGLIEKVKRLEREAAEWQWKYYIAKGLVVIKDRQDEAEEAENG